MEGYSVDVVLGFIVFAPADWAGSERVRSDEYDRAA